MSLQHVTETDEAQQALEPLLRGLLLQGESFEVFKKKQSISSSAG
jgi:hypothetical protein